MKTLLLLLTAAILSGCLPLKYRGTYISDGGEIEIKLKARKAVITLKNRESKKFEYLDTVLYSKTDPDTVSKDNAKQMLELQNGQDTVLLRKLSSVDIEVLYLIPDKSSLRKLGKTTWFNGEVYRIWLDLSKPKDKTIIKAFYCTNGNAQISGDESGEYYLVYGCPADVKYKPLKRQLPKGI